ncbi:hypothetical protein [Adhaeribacter rhizoryzae]|uniref:Uncharacterized protein n=1 Tax=Adhaeribacter rhizoryzae TaxID=2607907 RepID=A0A5M6D940_9BACT|nr:hypothetical protein [Adhaeribacter rhizoryzae]KAA5542990.1 hypothetical protein F0145_17805 [Adhaeribacter rhizoryzae]
MDNQQKLERILRVYYNASLQKPEKLIYFHDNYVSTESSLPWQDVNKILSELVDLNYIERKKDNENSHYFSITRKGIEFIKSGGYEGIIQREIAKQKAIELKEEEESAARKATVEQAKIAAEALDESRRARQIAQNALWVSIILGLSATAAAVFALLK